MARRSEDECGELTAAPLLQMATAFWVSKTLAAAVELELFTRLAEHQEATLEEATASLRIEPRPAILLLTACTALGLLEKRESRYRNSALAEKFLVAGEPYYLGGLFRLLDERHYLPWHRLTKALRTNRPLTWNPDTQDSMFSADDPVMLAHFWEALHALSSDTARILSSVYDFGCHQQVLDVGGGSGAFLIELCRRHAHLSGTLYDLPHVCDIAQRKITESGMEREISVRSGDFMCDVALPGGHDAILLSMILHDWDEPTNRMLLQKCRESLPPGGTLLICELIVNAERTGPQDAALMGMNMLAETTGGQNYAEDEYMSWLRETGFTRTEIRRFAAPGANGVIIARSG
ncbi:methyltransferase [Streptomyces spectabilis]|nr:methyltransferase/methylase [Streptomyces spectabilis]